MITIDGWLPCPRRLAFEARFSEREAQNLSRLADSHSVTAPAIPVESGTTNAAFWAGAKVGCRPLPRPETQRERTGSALSFRSAERLGCCLDRASQNSSFWKY